MEDKNMQPLVPDMLYRHSTESEEILSHEELPLEAVLFSNEEVAEAAISENEPVLPATAEAEPESILPPQEIPAPSFAVEEEYDPVYAAPAEEPNMDIAILSEEPQAEQASATEIDLDAPIFETSDQEAATVDAVIPAEEPVLWGTEDILSGSEYDTFEPEAVPAEALPHFQEPEFTDMNIEISEEAEKAPKAAKKEKKNKKNQEPAVKKGRPKHKKGTGFLGIPQIISTLIWLGIIVMIGSSLGKLLWVGAADVLAFGRQDKIVTVTIVDSDTIDTIATKLQEVGLVKYPALFKVYANLTGAEEEITTGSFTLNTNLDYHALTNALSPSSSSRAVVKVTIPEGYSCRQIFQLLASSNVCSVDALEEYAANGELPEYWFLENVTRGDKYCLEGYLFPDTYEFYANSTPKEALTRMLSGFNNRFTEDMQAQVVTLNQQLSDLMRSNGKSEDYIASHQLTVGEIMIIASLVEKETAGSAESATIASVIYNRLYNWGDTPAYLNIDASIYYALDGNIDPATGNTKVLTADDLKIDSPFNTYKYTGLTPTPITNPGLASIQAALSPKNTEYYYYVLNPETNAHQFSKTLEEHEKWVEKFYPKSED